jgi:hypothetical protein
MASVVITISGLSKTAQDLGALKDAVRGAVVSIEGLCWGLAQGAYTSAAGLQPAVSIAYSNLDVIFATGTLTASSASGAVGGTIGGTLKTVTAAGGDAATMVALAAAINADATINQKVRASADGVTKVCTLKALLPGALGNTYTLVASGTGMTASGATLTGGAGANAAGPDGVL